MFTAIDYHVIARTLSEVEGAVAIPWLEGKCIEKHSKIHEIATPLRPQARAERNRRFAAALSAELWRTGSQ